MSAAAIAAGVERRARQMFEDHVSDLSLHLDWIGCPETLKEEYRESARYELAHPAKPIEIEKGEP